MHPGVKRVYRILSMSRRLSELSLLLFTLSDSDAEDLACMTANALANWSDNSAADNATEVVMSTCSVPRHESYINLAYSKSGIWSDDGNAISNLPHVIPTYSDTGESEMKSDSEYASGALFLTFDVVDLKSDYMYNQALWVSTNSGKITSRTMDARNG